MFHLEVNCKKATFLTKLTNPFLPTFDKNFAPLCQPNTYLQFVKCHHLPWPCPELWILGAMEQRTTRVRGLVATNFLDKVAFFKASYTVFSTAAKCGPDRGNMLHGCNIVWSFRFVSNIVKTTFENCQRRKGQDKIKV